MESLHTLENQDKQENIEQNVPPSGRVRSLCAKAIKTHIQCVTCLVILGYTIIETLNIFRASPFDNQLMDILGKLANQTIKQ